MKDEWCGGEVVKVLWRGVEVATTTDGASRIRYFPVRQGNPLRHTEPIRSYRTKCVLVVWLRLIVFLIIYKNLRVIEIVGLRIFERETEPACGVLLENGLARGFSCSMVGLGILNFAMD